MSRRITLLLLVAVCAWAQGPLLDPEHPPQSPTVPTITFDYALPGAVPGHYTLILETTGRAAYRSDSPQRENDPLATPSRPVVGEPYIERFVISRPTRERIFEIAKQLRYFNGNFD